MNEQYTDTLIDSESLRFLVKMAFKHFEITLSRAAEILDVSLNEMRTISNQWAEELLEEEEVTQVWESDDLDNYEFGEFTNDCDYCECPPVSYCFVDQEKYSHCSDGEASESCVPEKDNYCSDYESCQDCEYFCDCCCESTKNEE